MTLHPDEQAREWQQTDIRHWFAANEKCPNCGIVLREMHPLVNLYPHWTGECRERAAAPSLHKEGLPAIEKLIRLIEASRDGFLDGQPYILTYSDIIIELEQIARGSFGDSLREFADKLEAAIKARDFTDGWNPFSVQQSCSEMVHEVLEDEMHVRAARPAEKERDTPG